MKPLEIISAGKISYEAGRLLQERIIQRIETGGQESIIFCEHPSVITAGKSVSEKSFCEILSRFEIPTVKTDRGGAFTYHGPGQLLIYPVINLRRHRLGVKRFIQKILDEVSFTLRVFDLETAVSLENNKTGLWIKSIDNIDRKVLAVGLRIMSGISNHGFALNVNVSFEYYKKFCPCNLDPSLITSLSEINSSIDIKDVQAALVKAFQRNNFME